MRHNYLLFYILIEISANISFRQNTTLSMGTASANLVKKSPLPSGSSARAVPIGQGTLRQRYIARRKWLCIFEESPYSAYAWISSLISGRCNTQ